MSETKLARTLDQWRKCDPEAMANMSQAAIMYALKDAKHDILALASISDAARAPDLSRISAILASEIECSVFEKDVQPALDVARKALAKDGPSGAIAWMVIGHYTELFTDLEEASKYALTIGMEVTPLYAAPVAPAAAAPSMPPHDDDAAVERFAAEMKAKLAAARAKGRSGWQQCNPSDLSRMLREHVEKGDPRDVANFCMFLWSLEAPISKAAQPDERAAPTDSIPLHEDMLRALEHVECVYRQNVVKDGEPSSTLANLQRVIARARATAPQATMPLLTDAMRAVLRNENCIYGSEDELYTALCAAADVEQRTNDDAISFIKDISTQKPEKPDYWSACGQCEHNIERAQEILESQGGT